VIKRADHLLNEIEAGALDSQTPIGDLLRKVITLGGEAESTELRDWAARELRGFGPDDDLPPYRRTDAPLYVDMVGPTWRQPGVMISPSDLPKSVREHINYEVALRMSITEIEEYARQAPAGGVLQWAPPGAEEAMKVINSQQKGKRVIHLYWGVSPVSLGGVVDKVRTTLTVMTAELRATMPEGAVIPSTEAATNAFTFALTGDRNKINLVTAQDGSMVTTAASTEAGSRVWWKTGGAVVGGLIGIATLIFGLMEVQGWAFG
jgi:hypothetical protein